MKIDCCNDLVRVCLHGVSNYGEQMHVVLAICDECPLTTICIGFTNNGDIGCIVDIKNSVVVGLRNNVEADVGSILKTAQPTLTDQADVFGG